VAESVAGQLLIASPSMSDWFRRAVVLVVEHTEDGAFGLVLNRPSETTVGEAAPDLAEIVGPEHVIHVGGPVTPNAVTALGDHLDPAESSKLLVESVGMVDLESPPELSRLRVFAGYAGWGPGQLEGELQADAWILEALHPDDGFCEEDLWSRALRRKGGQFTLLARMPEDPSLN